MAESLIAVFQDHDARHPATAGLAIRAPLIPLLLLLAGAVAPRPALAQEALQTFGPGKVSCQPLTGTQLDCLLASSRVTDQRNVATFDVDLLPAEDQVLFRRWCVAGSDVCSVTLTGRRESAQSTRLSAVTAVHWTRAGAPENEEVARTIDPTPAFRSDSPDRPRSP